MRKIEEVLRLHDAGGRSNREIAQTVQVSPTTVADYLRRARQAGLSWPLAEGLTERVEMPINGGSMIDRLRLAQSMLGQQVPVSSVFELGDLLDASAVTKGKGLQGPVRRWGIAMAKRKHARTGKLRHVGNLGPWNPSHISWRVPQLGQMGYHQRTEYNKRLMLIGSDGSKITPEGGFPGYGLVRNQYILIKGSLPGPVKRLVRMRHAIRPGMNFVKAPELLYVSQESKQGV